MGHKHFLRGFTLSKIRHLAWNTSRLIAQNCGLFSDALFRAASLYVKTYKNLNYDMTTNGEFYLLDRLAKTNVRTVLDVGANKGDYTNACLSRFPDAEVHSFEVVPATYQKLIGNVGSSKARLNNFGLSNFRGTVDINYNPDDDGSSSIVAGSLIHDGAWGVVKGSVIPGDDYISEMSIKTIDLLKVDVEGAEHLVFDGFRKSLAGGSVSAVQFEFGMVNIYSKFLLRDFWELFTKYGFIIGPLMPRGVQFREYDTRIEDFQGPPNYFAIHKSMTERIEAVKVRR
jgi:FkbM family methyltransferase